jgi:hypothetical protein
VDSGPTAIFPTVFPEQSSLMKTCRRSKRSEQEKTVKLEQKYEKKKRRLINSPLASFPTVSPEQSSLIKTCRRTQNDQNQEKRPEPEKKYEEKKRRPVNSPLVGRKAPQHSLQGRLNCARFALRGYRGTSLIRNNLPF